eukprot:1191391-Prorocentrum_minimum.AAC.5
MLVMLVVMLEVRRRRFRSVRTTTCGHAGDVLLRGRAPWRTRQPPLRAGRWPSLLYVWRGLSSAAPRNELVWCSFGLAAGAQLWFKYGEHPRTDAPFVVRGAVAGRDPARAAVLVAPMGAEEGADPQHAQVRGTVQPLS